MYRAISGEITGFQVLSSDQQVIVAGGNGGWLSRVARAFIEGAAGAAGNEVATQVMEGITDEGEQAISSSFDPREAEHFEFMQGDGTLIDGFEIDGEFYFDYDGDNYMDTKVIYDHNGFMWADTGSGFGYQRIEFEYVDIMNPAYEGPGGGN